MATEETLAVDIMVVVALKSLKEEAILVVTKEILVRDQFGGRKGDFHHGGNGEKKMARYKDVPTARGWKHRNKCPKLYDNTIQISWFTHMAHNKFF